ncbi:OmpH family outer membrane protein [Gabonibacter chumensis]|uniref:OmpH family outer membrane protein n=1 Tax=Gabonibacter chumensis TaxID=2972474 RepID=UPI002572747E|nr:OmpH family outer membrane protein [Gabonibacter chumensis]MCR9012927.1 OmpH family outer membrane protein [Gabonibacter chumensis]
MKNFSIGLNVLLLVAVVVLYILHFAGNNRAGNESEGVKVVNPGTKIVYINMDTLLSNYTQSRELNEAFLKKIEKYKTDMNVKMKSLVKRQDEYQRKLENNGFVTRESANQEYYDIVLESQNMERLKQETQENILREQNEINKKLYDVIIAFLKEYNKEKGYNLILSTTLGGTVFYAEDGFDITQDILKQLNAQYKKK